MTAKGIASKKSSAETANASSAGKRKATPKPEGGDKG